VANCAASNFRTVQSGVQGSVLGPIIFIVFINDIIDLFGGGLAISKVKLYSDDVKMYTAIHDISSVAVLKSGLDELNLCSAKGR